MDDLISRQAAIDAILHNQEVYSNNFGNEPIDRYTIAIIDNDAQTIAKLPPAQPERKTGKWIIDYLCSTSGGTYQVLRCSICKHLEQPWQLGLNFCPNCGTRMKGEDND